LNLGVRDVVSRVSRRGADALSATDERWWRAPHARAYMMVLPKKREHRAHWQHACRLLLQRVGAAALTRQVQVALMDGKLHAGAFEHMSSARRWRNGRACRTTMILALLTLATYSVR
jgi:hypothetical protein